MVITSKDNQAIKEIKKLKEAKFRKSKYIVEGMKMLEEAFQENVKIETIIIRQGEEKILERVNELLGEKNVERKNANNNEENIENLSNIKNKMLNSKVSNKPKVIEVSENVFNQLTDVKTPQGVIAVVYKNIENNINKESYNEDSKCNKKINSDEAGKSNTNNKQEDEISKIDLNADYILAIDGIQDPGNMGTIIRTADSANLKQILVSKNTVDAYSSKVIRSTMGAIYRVKIIECKNLKDTLEKLKNYNFKIVSTSLDTNNSIYDIDYNKKVIVIGNEGNGISKEIQDISDYKVKIPMLGKTESLNASVAAGVMIYEYIRQKLRAGKWLTNEVHKNKY